MKGPSKRALCLMPTRNAYAVVKYQGCGRAINEENNPSEA